MDEETVERVARAIAKTSGWPDDMWDNPGAYSTSTVAKEAYVAFARAAIEAMQTPGIPVFATTEGPKETFQGKRKG